MNRRVGEAKTIQPEQERVKEMDESNSLQVLKKLEAIESLLRQLPEIMAATYLGNEEAGDPECLD